MTYFPSRLGDTELIAREGYAGLGLMLGQPVPTSPMITDAQLAAAHAAAPKEPSMLQKIGTGLKTTLDYYGKQIQQGQGYGGASGGGGLVRTSGGLPSWVLPVAIVGGVGLLALVLLKKKGKKNPARRRRSRRRRSHRR